MRVLVLVVDLPDPALRAVKRAGAASASPPSAAPPPSAGAAVVAGP